jgi:hypothetical protein
MPRGIETGVQRCGLRLLCAAVLVLAGLAGGPGEAGAGEAGTVARMRSDAWFETLSDRVESEAELAARTLPAVPAALAREWRSLDRHGSAVATFADLGWIVLVATIARLGEKLAANAPRRRPEPFRPLWPARLRPRRARGFRRSSRVLS